MRLEPRESSSLRACFFELSGKALGFDANPAGFNRFSLEFTTVTGADTLRTSKQQQLSAQVDPSPVREMPSGSAS